MTEAETQLNAALSAHRAGDIDGALAAYRATLALDPLQPDAMHMLGVIALQKHKPELALQLLDTALAVKSDMPSAWYNRGLVLRSLQRPVEALESVAKALALMPDYAEAWNLSGLLALDNAQTDRARHDLSRSIVLEPGNAKFYADYAFFLLTIHDLPAAHAAMREALRLDPACMPLTLANILKSAGYPQQALSFFERARALLPGNAAIAASEAMAWLQIGEWEQGWKLWEQRPDDAIDLRHLPLWDGQPTDHLLLYEDQGMGDALQCVRFIPLLKTHAPRITLRIAPPLKKLLAATFPWLTIIAADEPLPPDCKARLRLLSLPALLNITLATLPVATPYIHAQAAWGLPWHQRLAAIPYPRIGLVWGGNPGHRNDFKRSIAFAAIKALLDVAAPHLLSLQTGPQGLSAHTGAPLFDTAPWLTDFTATAGLLANLDLLITVDTSIAHLAGAMGRPVWLLLPFDPDWRWLLGREDSPWYPTLRLFRQTAPQSWPDLLARVETALKTFIHDPNSLAVPPPWQGPPLKQDPNPVDLGFQEQAQ